MGTLQGIYFEKMMGRMSYNLSNVVTIGERIENGLKTGKISGTTNHQEVAKKPQNRSNKKIEGETSVVMENFHP